MRESIPDALRAALRELTPQLEALEAAQLPDAWLAAGAIRNRVWDRVLGERRGPGSDWPSSDWPSSDWPSSDWPSSDWDVAFAGDVPEDEAMRRLMARLPGPWEPIDQRAFAHGSASEGIASWPETATAIGARRVPGGLELVAPWGLDDLVSGILRRGPRFMDEAVFQERQEKKRWRERWPALKSAPWIAPGDARPALLITRE